jgi:taurine dioxygenase
MTDWQLLGGPFGVSAGDTAIAALDPEEVLNALYEHQLLVFRNQTLSISQFEDLARGLGELDQYPYAEPVAGSKYVVPVVKERHERHNFGGQWHTDTSYLERPPAVTMLLAGEVPPEGGDTLFADMNQAYADLSPGLQNCLIRLSAINTSALVHDPSGAHSAVAGDRSGPDAPVSSACHPVVRRHPVTGRPALYVSLVHTERFTGMTRLESLPLLEYLQQRATGAGNCVRLSWQPGTLAIWDNRVLQHYPLNDYPGQRRAMLRIILRGEQPEAFNPLPGRG